jgi:hypothetical protein
MEEPKLDWRNIVGRAEDHDDIPAKPRDPRHQIRHLSRIV